MIGPPREARWCRQILIDQHDLLLMVSERNGADVPNCALERLQSDTGCRDFLVRVLALRRDQNAAHHEEGQ